MLINFHDLLGRIGPFAIIDIVLTILLGEFILYYLKSSGALGVAGTTTTLRIFIIVFVFYLSIFVHLITNTKTPLTNMIIN